MIGIVDTDTIRNERIFNTGETASSLREEYNPDGSVLRKAQMRMLEMLDYIDAVCREQGISYRLDSGNVIGALRHGGFIPWDDDVDIALSLGDYRRLCRYLKRNPHPYFVLQSPETDRKYIYPWNKLRDTHTEYVMNYAPDSKEAKVFNQQTFKGLQIDIFPFEDRTLPLLHRLAGKMACVAAFDVGQKHPIFGKMIFYFNMKIAFPLFRLLGKMFGNSQIVAHTYGTWFYRRCNKSDILPYSQACFEDRVYPMPANPEAFCTSVYGDYTKLPPQSARQYHATAIIFKGDD